MKKSFIATTLPQNYALKYIMIIKKFIGKRMLRPVLEIDRNTYKICFPDKNRHGQNSIIY